MKRALIALLVGACLAAFCTSAQAAGSRSIISAPVMGWNDWNAFGCNVSAKLVEQQADFLVSSGLRDKGYDYVNIDDCWASKQRDSSGQLVADPTKFPDGITAVADYVHARGLKLGLYADAGTQTCGGYPGSLGHEQTDAQTFASWGVDLLKYDNCHPGSGPAQQHYYQAMDNALNATGRQIVFSVCEWGLNKPWNWAPGIGDYWRIDGDINPNWDSMKSIGRQLMRHYNGWSGPGFPDADMLEIGNGGLNATEERTHFGLWALYGSPLILGTDLTKLSSDELSLVSNSDVIAVDQQAAGHPVHQVTSAPGQYVLARGMSDGSTIVALYNEGNSPAPIATTAAAAGVSSAPSYQVKDLWAGSTTATTGELTRQVPAHGLTLLRVTPSQSASTPAPNFTLNAPRDPGEQEYLAGPQGTPVTATLSDSTGAASLTVPKGWHTSAPTTTQSGTTKRWTWMVWPSGTATGEVTAKTTSPVQTATLDLIPTPSTPTGNTSVAILPWLHDWAGYLEPKRNAAVDGSALQVNGQNFSTGVGTHSESEVAVWLGGNCSRLTTSVGLQSPNTSGGSVQGVVEGDGKTLATSNVSTAGMAAQTLSVDVTGVKYLVLETGNGGDSSYADGMVWAGTQLTCGS